LKIGNYKIGINQPPFIIAEMSGNHNQSLDRALQIVEAAAKSGCHALKIQTYTADTMTIDCKRKNFYIDDEKSLWKGAYLYELYQKAYTPWEWHQAIFKRCQELGFIGFSTPFDETAVDFLESLNVPAYKIASFENADLPLIKKVAATGKPMIISTGMASIAELDETVQVARASGCKDIILLKCTSAYPSLPKEANLRTIPHMADLFQCLVGLSDHTKGIAASVASIALGARVIEKHFTLSRLDGGVDSAFSLEPDEMKSLVKNCKDAFDALGGISYGLTKNEENSKRFRRSIFVIKAIKAGEKLTRTNIRIIRPGDGLAPKYFEIILGKVSSKSISQGSPLDWSCIK